MLWSHKTLKKGTSYQNCCSTHSIQNLNLKLQIYLSVTAECVRALKAFFLSNTKSTYCLSSMHVFQEHNQAFEESSCYAHLVQIFLKDLSTSSVIKTKWKYIVHLVINISYTSLCCLEPFPLFWLLHNVLKMWIL